MAVHRRQHPLLLPALSTLAAQLLLLICALLCYVQLASSSFCSSAAACLTSTAPVICAAPANSTAVCSTLISRSRFLISFPFFTSEECQDNNSSFIITGCNSTAEVYPHWPGFTRHAMSDSQINQTFITHMYNAFASTRIRSSPDADASILYVSNPFNISNGYLNLTWNRQLQEQNGSGNVCKIIASANQTSDYIPSSINLQNFAQSGFRFDPSNILLLFNCSGSQQALNYSAYLIRNSSACMAYQKECNQNRDGQSNCYQYMIPNPGQKLSVTQLMNDMRCKQMMFYVALNSSLPAKRWTPGLVRLTWSLSGTNGLGKTLGNCVNCFDEDGLCGYDSTDNFQCQCSSECFAQAGSSWVKGNKFKIAVGTGAGSLVVTLVVALLLITFVRSKKKKAGSAGFCSGHDYKAWITRPSFLLRKPDPNLAREIPYDELVCATESFKKERILGDGGFGAVYRGVLADGCNVAVKRLHHDNYKRMELFYNEMKVLSSIKHPNLVKLCGFCACEREQELLLVFEFASHGTVSDHLHKGLLPPLPWGLRLSIACETADALSYLHNTVTPPIYHRDVKTANILLDDNFHAKLADFGLSKLVHSRASSHISTSPQGTPGYLDPEYHQCYQLTDKSDVYSLGVVLMELISGKLAVDLTRERGEVNLSTYAVMKIQCDRMEELLDPNLQATGDPTTQTSIERVVELAFQCLQTCRDDRPSMACVAETLAHIHKQYKEASIFITEKPFPSSGFSFASTDSSHHSSNLSSS